MLVTYDAYLDRLPDAGRDAEARLLEDRFSRTEAEYVVGTVDG